MLDLRRRHFLTLLGGAAMAWPLGAGAQQPRMPVIGFLNGASPEKYEPFVNAFLQGLKETGYTDSQNLIIEYRSADGSNDLFSKLARELVALDVDVMVTRGTPAALAARPVTSVASSTAPSPMNCRSKNRQNSTS